MATENPRLSLANLHLIDGGVLAEEFDRELRAIERDLKARPHFEKARRLTITLAFDPYFDGPGPTTLSVKGEVKHLLPREKPEKCKHAMALAPDGGIAFNPEAPENPAQATFGDEE